MKIIIAYTIIQFFFWLKRSVCDWVWVCVCVCGDLFECIHDWSIIRRSVSASHAFFLFLLIFCPLFPSPSLLTYLFRCLTFILRFSALVLLDHLHNSSKRIFSSSPKYISVLFNSIFCRYRCHHSTLCVCLFVLIPHMNRAQTIQCDGWYFFISSLSLSVIVEYCSNVFMYSYI